LLPKTPKPQKETHLNISILRILARNHLLRSFFFFVFAITCGVEILQIRGRVARAVRACFLVLNTLGLLNSEGSGGLFGPFLARPVEAHGAGESWRLDFVLLVASLVAALEGCELRSRHWLLGGTQG